MVILRLLVGDPKLTAPPAPEPTRWRFLIHASVWLLEHPQRPHQVITSIAQAYNAVSDSGVDIAALPADAQAAVRFLLSPVFLASAAIAADVGVATTEAELTFVESNGGCQMLQIHDYFTIMARKRAVYGQAAEALSGGLSAEMLAQGKLYHERWRDNTLKPEQEFAFAAPEASLSAAIRRLRPTNTAAAARAQAQPPGSDAAQPARRSIRARLRQPLCDNKSHLSRSLSKRRSTFV